jgi:hypothetical protein
MIDTKYCKDFEIELCRSCEVSRGTCALSAWKYNIKHNVLDILLLIKYYKSLGNPIWFNTSLKYYYPEKYKEFSKLSILL